MDKNLAAFLDPEAYTISVQYQHDYSNGKQPGNGYAKNAGWDKTDEPVSRAYTYVTNIKGLAIGDTVVVPTAVRGSDYVQPRLYKVVDDATPESINSPEDLADIGDMDDNVFAFDKRISVARIVKIDKQVELEPNSDVEYQWVIGVVDMDPYVRTMLRNRKAVTAAQGAYKRNLRRSYADRVLADMDESERNNLMALMAPAKKG